jgi:hypothetical protein
MGDLIDDQDRPSGKLTFLRSYFNWLFSTHHAIILTKKETPSADMQYYVTSYFLRLKETLDNAKEAQSNRKEAPSNAKER